MTDDLQLTDSIANHPAVLNCPELDLTGIANLRPCEIVKFLHAPKSTTNETAPLINEVNLGINSYDLERTVDFYYQLVELIQTRFQSDAELCRFALCITETKLNYALLPDQFSVINKTTKEFLHYSYKYPHVMFERHPINSVRYCEIEEEESDSDHSL
uniref:Uncharacterized protein n=1 Tax=Ditylenchus dipsaci TaxID=166011 RepID=A0A915CXS1_9BILA